MPRIENQDARRASLINVAAKLIAETGMDGLTIRSVAKAAGVSTGVVSHYFSDKRDLLIETYDATADEVYERVAREHAQGGSDAQSCLEGFLPMDAVRVRGWRVWFAFWGLAIGDREFAKDQKLRARRAQDLVATVLSVGLGGRLRPTISLETGASMILGLIQGIAAQTVFDPKEWSAARQSEVLAEALRGLCEED
jgi:AcrR family transcriptional regulator